MSARGYVKGLLVRRGWELRRLSASPMVRRQHLLDAHGIDLVVDVGANAGQYATELRASGYRGRILSFEPLPGAFAQLQRAATGDENWEVRNVALGPVDGQIEFNVSRDGVCSSVLEATDTLTRVIPQGGVVDTIEVPQIRLDEAVPAGVPLMFKIDTQGYEHHVLDGGAQTLSNAVVLDIEMALVELYEGGSSIYDLLPRLRREGFGVVSIDPGFVDPESHQTLDVDVLMVRT
jgi:FkbM family methyltransferase